MAAQSFSSTNWEWAYYFVSSSSASGSGTITVNFGKSGNTIVDLVALSGASTGAPVVTGNVGTASGSGTSATANLPSARASTDAGVVMVGGPADFGPSTPSASPSMTNLLYSHSPSGALATFDVVPGSQNETVTISSATWGAIALEISAPLGLNGNTTTTTASAPSTGTDATAITASAISSALSGATSGAAGTITFTVFGPQSTAPTTCTTGGTTVGTASVSGNGTYNPGAGFTPSSAGTYWWYASYSGDLSSNQSSSSTCGSGMTSTVVATAPTTTTVSGPGSDTSGTAICDQLDQLGPVRRDQRRDGDDHLQGLWPADDRSDDLHEWWDDGGHGHRLGQRDLPPQRRLYPVERRGVLVVHQLQRGFQQ